MDEVDCEVKAEKWAWIAKGFFGGVFITCMVSYFITRGSIRELEKLRELNKSQPKKIEEQQNSPEEAK